MARLSYKELDKIKEHYDVDTVWSWSRINCYVSQPWEFMIRYIRREKVNTNNIYGIAGTICHDIIQGYIEGEHKQEDMLPMFQNEMLSIDLGGEYKFPSENVRKGYVDNLKHYFKHTEYPVETMEKSVEKTVMTKFKRPDGKNIIFVGYIDLLTRDPKDGKVVIVDFKSSSSGGFVGKKLQESSRQLKLYAMGISQMYNIPINQIKIRYDMQKYVTVSYKQKNGKWSKPSLKERCKWVESQQNRIKKALTESGYGLFDSDEMYERAVLDGDLDSLPQDVQDLFSIEAGIIDMDMTEPLVEEMNEWIVSNVLEAERRSKAEDLDAEFPEHRDIDNEFYFNVLAPGLKPFNKAWAEKQELKRIMEDETVVDEFDFDSLFE